MTNRSKKPDRTNAPALSGVGRSNRREVMRLGSAGLIGALAARRADASDVPRAKFKALGENDRIDVGDRAKQMIEKAYDVGFELEKKHGGCARCTVAALQKSIEFVPENKALFRTASCLDGGATPKGVQSCGAFTGAGMVVGWVCGNEAFGDTKLSHKLIRQVCERFEAEYGSVLCKDVKAKAESNCPKVVARSAKWTAEVLLSQFTNYEQEKETSNG